MICGLNLNKAVFKISEVSKLPGEQKVTPSSGNQSSNEK